MDYCKYVNKRSGLITVLFLFLIFTLPVRADAKKKVPLSVNTPVQAPTTAPKVKPRKALNPFRTGKSKIIDSSGLAAANVTSPWQINVVAMGDGKPPVDYARGGMKDTVLINAGLTQPIDTRVRAKVQITKIQGSASIWLKVTRDGNTSMLLSPIRKNITANGTYTLEVLKQFSIESNHRYEAAVYIEINQPGKDSVIAAAGKITELKWIYE